MSGAVPQVPGPQALRRGQRGPTVWEKRLLAAGAGAFLICLTAANATSTLMSQLRQGSPVLDAVSASVVYTLILLAPALLPVLALTILGWSTQARGARWAALAGLVVVDLTALPLMLVAAALLSRPSPHPDGAMGPIIVGVFGGVIAYAIAAVVLAGCGLAWLVRGQVADPG